MITLRDNQIEKKEMQKECLKWPNNIQWGVKSCGQNLYVCYGHL